MDFDSTYNFLVQTWLGLIQTWLTLVQLTYNSIWLKFGILVSSFGLDWNLVALVHTDGCLHLALVIYWLMSC